MNQIQQLNATVSKVRDLSPTAREYTFLPEHPLPFIAGAFVNVFVDHDGKTIRRAFSISSSDKESEKLTVSIRLSPDGELTPLLWDEDFTGQTVRLMGPLGLNTAEKMKAKRIFLFGFGVGAGVVKSLTEHMLHKPDLESLTVVTGNRSTNEILHKEYFDEIAKNPKTSVQYVVSDQNQSEYPKGYIQEHIAKYDFSNADVYICGQKVACDALESSIKSVKPQDCRFFVEDFH